MRWRVENGTSWAGTRHKYGKKAPIEDDEIEIIVTRSEYINFFSPISQYIEIPQAGQ